MQSKLSNGNYSDNNSYCNTMESKRSRWYLYADSKLYMKIPKSLGIFVSNRYREYCCRIWAKVQHRNMQGDVWYFTEEVDTVTGMKVSKTVKSITKE